jgi:hypothetical protein
VPATNFQPCYVSVATLLQLSIVDHFSKSLRRAVGGALLSSEYCQQGRKLSSSLFSSHFVFDSIFFHPFWCWLASNSCLNTFSGTNRCIGPHQPQTVGGTFKPSVNYACTDNGPWCVQSLTDFASQGWPARLYHTYRSSYEPYRRCRLHPWTARASLEYMDIRWGNHY